MVCYLGTGEHASQQGMNIGGIRHASDIKADDMTSQSQGMLHPQTGNALWPAYLLKRDLISLCK